MDAFYLGVLNSSIGTFQRNMIEQFAASINVDELHVLTSTKPESSLRYDNCYYHLCGHSIIQSGRCVAKLDKLINPDIIFYTFNLIPPFEGGLKAIRVLQNHDWSHARFSETMKERIVGNIYEMMHRSSAREAQTNIANSEFTQEETKAHSGRDSAVIYHDADPIYKNRRLQNLDNDKLPDPLTFDYIIYAGRVKPAYKNIHSLLLAFELLLGEYRNLKLVIVHSDPFRKSDTALVRKFASNLINLSNISKLELKYLYENSICMVYPSIYEGFGSPILEAQNVGTPVIAYHGKPMTEVGGDSALYSDMSVQDLAEKLSILIEDPQTRRELISKGLNNTKRFDWKITAEKTLEVFHG